VEEARRPEAAPSSRSPSAARARRIPTVAAPFELDLRHAPGATLLFLFGVFFTFAPMLVLSVTPGRELAPSTIALWFVISGICGTLWALGGVVSSWLFIPAGAMQLFIAFAIGQRWFGAAGLSATKFNSVGGVAMLSIAAGYTCFVTYIVRHARRSIALSAEMALAARIHQHLVPDLAFECGPFQIAARSEASGVMGGDVMHAVPLADGAIEAIVADVSGHGVRAGVVMAMVRSAMESHRGRRAAGDGRALVTDLALELNRVLVALTEPDMFVTAVIIHAAPNGVVHVAGAGHPPLLHRHARLDEGERVTALALPGLPLGVIEDFEPTLETLTLERGDALVLYTDGLTETALARSAARPRDGRAGVQRLDIEGLTPLVASAPDGVMNAVEYLLDAVDAAGGRLPAEDDRTVLVLADRRDR